MGTETREAEVQSREWFCNFSSFENAFFVLCVCVYVCVCVCVKGFVFLKFSTRPPIHCFHDDCTRVHLRDLCIICTANEL